MAEDTEPIGVSLLAQPSVDMPSDGFPVLMTTTIHVVNVQDALVLFPTTDTFISKQPKQPVPPLLIVPFMACSGLRIRHPKNNLTNKRLKTPKGNRKDKSQQVLFNIKRDDNYHARA